MAHSKEIIPFLHKKEGVVPTGDSYSQAAIDLGNDVWKSEMPDETVQLDVPALEAITRGTMSSLCNIAAEIKKTQQFAKVARRVLLHNGLSVDETTPPTPEEIASTLEAQAKWSPYVNTFERYFIKYERGNFSVKMQEVVYGNCPECYWAMPLGYICSRCTRGPFTIRAQYIYVSGPELDADINRDFNVLNERNMVPYDPIDLSYTQLKITPMIDMVYNDFIGNENYVFEKNPRENYWTIHLSHMVSAIMQSERKHEFIMNPYKFVAEWGGPENHWVAYAIIDYLRDNRDVASRDDKWELIRSLQVANPDRFVEPGEDDPPEEPGEEHYFGYPHVWRSRESEM